MAEWFKAAVLKTVMLFRVSWVRIPSHPFTCYNIIFFIMFNKFQQNDLIIFNQLKSKLLFKNSYEFETIDSVQINVNLFKLKSFNEDIILESAFLLESLTYMKSFIKYYKRMYQEVNLQLAVTLRKFYTYYFLILLKVFYFPIFRRRNLILADSFDSYFNFNFAIKSINTFLFVPDIFFK